MSSNNFAAQFTPGDDPISSFLNATNHTSLKQVVPINFCANYIQAFNGNSTGQANVQRFLFTSLFIISVIGLIFVACTIIYNKKLQAHPQMLIAMICLAEACLSYNALLQVIDPVYFSCYFGIEKLFTYTTYFKTNEIV